MDKCSTCIQKTVDCCMLHGWFPKEKTDKNLVYANPSKCTDYQKRKITSSSCYGQN